MSASRLIYAIIGALTLAVVAGLGWQHHATTELRGEIARLRTLSAQKARLSAAHQRLAAAQASAADVENLRAERARVSALRAELEAMRSRAEVSARRSALRTVSETGPKPAAHSLKEHAVPAGEWKNVGRATPEAAFETALWAAAGGDIETLAGLLVLDADARAKAEALLASLPEAMQGQLVTPERLIALLTAKDVPLGSAKILGQFLNQGETKLVAQLLDPDGKSKLATLSLRAEGGRWGFGVSGKIVERYATMLRTPPPAAVVGGQ